jgi:hypothetical protein
MKHFKVYEEFITEGEGFSVEELNGMAMSQLQSICDGVTEIMEKMKSGQQLESWMYSQITVAEDKVISVNTALQKEEA